MSGLMWLLLWRGLLFGLSVAGACALPWAAWVLRRRLTGRPVWTKREKKR